MEAQQIALLSKEEISKLPLFKNLSSNQIVVLQTLDQCIALQEELYNTALFGFDSESKPTFTKGETQTGPHLIQLATLEKAYLFQVNPEILNFLAPIFSSHDQIKIGFGLKNDAHLFRKKGIELNSIIELSKCFSSFGYKNQVGLKNAIAILFNEHFPKSKKISTSNWARKELTPQQISYAAADTYGAILVFEELLRLGLLPKKHSEHQFKAPNTNLKPRIRPIKIKPSSDA
ncbi:exonuclease [Acinetobacter sp. Ac_877]|uniref:3'-5' exonuclease n=1 Tax=Acinetobacter portensis TaxID=1839785 RepID=UPI00128B13F3|nr:3'-5' exonuclease [Acinetobacter portensis]MPW42495.1 exonuclease [Acinetobacter portensis]